MERTYYLLAGEREKCVWDREWGGERREERRVPGWRRERRKGRREKGNKLRKKLLPSIWRHVRILLF
jgi:hypothetical protein